MNNIKESLPIHYFEDLELGGIFFDIVRCSEMRPISRASFAHRHSFYEILHIEQGKGMHIIDFKPYSVEPASLYFLSPGQVHFWELSGPLQGSAIMFTEEFLLSSSSEQSLINELAFFHNVFGSPHLILSRDQDESIHEIIRHMQKEYLSNEYGRVSVLQSCLRILLIRIQRMFPADRIKGCSVQPSSLVNNFKKIVWEHFLTQRNVSFYADKLGVSEAHLYEVVKRITGVTPGQIIRNEIVIEAKRQLAHTDLSIAEIGYKLDFEDPSYFARFFSRETGKSPRAFRSHIREKYQIFTG